MDSVESSEQEQEPAEGDPPRDVKARIETAFEVLSEEVRELSLGTTGEVERVEGPLSPVDFLRNYVLPGRPCIITNALKHWPALQKWSNEYLSSVLKDQNVSVHFTPDGRADSLVDPLRMLTAHNCPIVTPTYITTPTSPSAAPSSESLSTGFEEEAHKRNIEHEDVHNGNAKHEIVRKYGHEVQRVGYGSYPQGLLFVRAHVEKLPFPEALELIVKGSAGGGGKIEQGGVAYAQEQNGCFLSEYGELTGDAEVHISWATEALGSMPEAVNLWIGNQNAVTSFHKDHYENLYAVVAGAKHFTLLPPVDVHRMYIKAFPSAQYVRMKDGRNFGIVLDEPSLTVPWVGVDPYPTNHKAKEALFPRYFNGSQPFTCTVQAGEILYLPSMWFHHVRQSPDREGRTIALNFWYDMQFDIKYAYFNMMQSLI